jgi:hypothetical protein
MMIQKMFTYDGWILVLILIALLRPANLATKELRKVHWYQRKFPLIVNEDGRTSGKRKQLDGGWSFAHWLFFEGLGEVLTLIFFGVGWFYFLFKNKQSNYYTPINALGVIFIGFFLTVPFVFARTDRFFYDRSTGHQFLAAVSPANSKKKQSGSEKRSLGDPVGNYGLWRAAGSPRWLITAHIVILFVVILIECVLILIQSTPDLEDWHRYIVAIFLFFTAGMVLFGMVTLIHMVHIVEFYDEANIPASERDALRTVNIEMLVYDAYPRSSDREPSRAV